ncbi:hypothetical protein [Streptosporangium sp. NBC_01756]|nr:hypothetical protein [Streptosporangium sp. NBC_01756]WSC90805.1 hypothetical protein OIE48_26280 [Streptosporangium sp. NBC_01756]
MIKALNGIEVVTLFVEDLAAAQRVGTWSPVTGQCWYGVVRAHVDSMS